MVVKKKTKPEINNSQVKQTKYRTLMIILRSKHVVDNVKLVQRFNKNSTTKEMIIKFGK